MIFWITGKAKSGKTTLAYRMAKQIKGIVLDGDDVRKYFPEEYDSMSIYRHLERITNFALILENQGFNVIISCISPDRSIRKYFQRKFESCIEICLPFGTMWEGTKYEYPKD